MVFTFHGLHFTVQNGEIFCNGGRFVEIQISGENKDSHFGNKMVCSSEGHRMRYIAHMIQNNTLRITQQTDAIQATTILIAYPDSETISAHTEVVNITGGDCVLEYVSAFVLYGFGSFTDTQNSYLYRFTQRHHGECQPIKSSLFHLGLQSVGPTSQQRIAGYNIGSWSTKEELPQGIIEHGNEWLLFTIESNNSWYWEISDYNNDLYLYLGGANMTFGSWSKRLKPQEKYSTPIAAFCMRNTLHAVLRDITVYRRHKKAICLPDRDLPSVFNEYMHCAWDSPNQNQTKMLAPTVAKLGIQYYVIDCGWHDEEDGNVIYPYVGRWQQSRKRFPDSVRAITDYIRSLGMHAGLWIEPEIVGYKCAQNGGYSEDCFIRRNGKKVCVMGRYFLDYRNEKVIARMNEAIRRMVEDYGAEYIKMDYNQELGVGTDVNADSFGEGLEQCSAAFLQWINSLRKRYPSVLFEACASGGMRLDFQTLQHFSLASTSDQTDYKKYPHIVANILSVVLPEQAAVWSYPVVGADAIGQPFSRDKTWVKDNVSDEQIIMNMINCLLGRMHLASHVELLSEKQLALVQEGIAFYNLLRDIKQNAFPYLPLGFNDFTEPNAACGLQYGRKIYLAVWSLGVEQQVTVPIPEGIRTITVGYPKNKATDFDYNADTLFVTFSESYQARFFEIETVCAENDTKCANIN